MADQTIALRVLTGEGFSMDDEAVSVIAPGERGYLGILRHHAPLVTTLKPGRLTWRRPDGSRHRMTVGEGLLEISRNRCTVLTDAASAPAPVPEPRGAV